MGPGRAQSQSETRVIFWLKDETLEDSANLPVPGIIAREIVDDLEAALKQLRATVKSRIWIPGQACPEHVEGPGMTNL